MTVAALVAFLVLATTTPGQQPGGFSGTISDIAGKPLRNATIVVADAPANYRWMTTSDVAGEFRFSSLPAGAYSVTVLSAVQTGYKNQGYETRKSSIQIEPGRDIREHFRLRLVVGVESAQVRPEAYVRPARASTPYLTLAHQSLEPNLVRRVEPVRPQNNAPGPVTLSATIGKDGRIDSLRIVAPDTSHDLARAAVEAVSQWLYRPFILRGEPRDVQTTIVLDFPAAK